MGTVKTSAQRDKAKIEDRKRADQKRKALDDYKVEQGCVDCGYNAHPAALEFDHLPGYVKCANVGGMMYKSWKVIWQEIDKCEVVCSNCHSIRTWERNAPLPQRQRETA